MCYFRPECRVNFGEKGTIITVKRPIVTVQEYNQQVGQVKSAENQKLVTFVGTVYAVRKRIPPLLIFPRICYKDHFTKGASRESMGLASSLGG
jgi:hypothetical protein